MVEISEAAILKRAKALARQDGYAWQLDFTAPIPGAKLELKRSLDRDPRLRNEYLALAKERLERESRDA